MRISGGTIFGYCATGRLNIVTSPTTTCKMAMTIATMGRLMKKRYIKPIEILSFLGRRGGVRRTGVVGLGIHNRSLLDLLCALGNHAVVRIESAVDHPVSSHLHSHLHRFYVGSVL